MAVFGLGLAIWWWVRHTRPATPFAGYVEAEYVKVGPVQSGLLTELSVSRGQTVQAGAPLFAQDDTGDRAARDEAASRMHQAEALLANLQGTSRVTDIEAAKATVGEARAAAALARDELKRGNELVPEGAIAPQRLEELRSLSQQANARLVSAEARLATLQAAIGRSAEIQAQQRATEAARATLASANWRLSQRHVAAPVAGLVADTIFRAGEQVNAGMPVVSLLPPENLLVRFFVPEPVLPSLRIGGVVDVSCDVCPTGLRAIVSFIAPQAEYTPPVIYSEQVREKLVFLIEAHPSPDAALTVLKPGQPVDVRVRQ
jgi:HlyD family secretion protein